jgi:hypothetical protein
MPQAIFRCCRRQARCHPTRSRPRSSRTGSSRPRSA